MSSFIVSTILHPWSSNNFCHWDWRTKSWFEMYFHAKFYQLDSNCCLKYSESVFKQKQTLCLKLILNLFLYLSLCLMLCLNDRSRRWQIVKNKLNLKFIFTFLWRVSCHWNPKSIEVIFWRKENGKIQFNSNFFYFNENCCLKFIETFWLVNFRQNKVYI